MPRTVKLLDTLFTSLGQAQRAEATRVAALAASPGDPQLLLAVFESYVRYII